MQLELEYILILCDIYNEFGDLEEKLGDKIREDRYFLQDLCKLAIGFKVFGRKSVHKFYEENKAIISLINHHMTFAKFVQDNFNAMGQTEIGISTFHRYILENQNDIEKIKTLLTKLYSLGISTIYLEKGWDFTEETYSMCPNDLQKDGEYFYFSYVPNCKLVPSTDQTRIYYNSMKANYSILCRYLHGLLTDANIYLNSLTLDPNELPYSLVKEETYEKIIALRNGKQEYIALDETVQLATRIGDLQMVQEVVANRIASSSTLKEKEELLALLTTISSSISKMQEISKRNITQVAGTYPEFSSEYIEKEQKEYVRRRENMLFQNYE